MTFSLNPEVLSDPVGRREGDSYPGGRRGIFLFFRILRRKSKQKQENRVLLMLAVHRLLLRAQQSIHAVSSRAPCQKHKERSEEEQGKFALVR